MRKTEQKLWDRLRSNLGKHVRLERVENVVTVGMPDVIAVCCSKVVWIELKAVEEYPARKATPILGEAKGLSIHQRNWHIDWARWGGVSIVLVGVGSNDIYALRGRDADSINQYTKDDMYSWALAADWNNLKDFLCS